ncbi:MAG: TonB-dependent receptor [Bacteroidales bacterium]
MTQTIKTLVVLFCVMLTSLSLSAQNNTITVNGSVLNTDGEPIIGAGVIIKGTSTGVASDMDGKFSISTTPDATLLISSIGYDSKEVKVNNQTKITVRMESDVVALQDAVVVGYGSQKKVNLTGSVASVSKKDIEGKPVANIIEALQGTTPGLVIQQGSSYPGSSPSINIRGLNTMNDNNPMVLIDGIEGSLANVNPSDIEQISVLKDASSTSIYGSRASNGIILVSTKKGQEGKTEVSYDFTYGLQQPTSLPKIADSWVYAELYNEAAVNSGRSTKFSASGIANYRNGGTNCNWVKELYKDNSPQSSHNISITGGNSQLSYLASFGYLDQDSMFKGANYGYKRYNARLNLSHKVNDKLVIYITSQFARNKIKDHAYWTEWIIEQCNRMPPIYNIKNDDGTYNYPAGSNSNSLQRLEEGGYRRSINDELAGTVKAEWELFKGFKLVGNAGGRLLENGTHENRKAIEGTGDAENKMTEQSYRANNFTTSVLAQYNKTIKSHTFGGMIGYAYEGYSNKSFSTSRITDDSKYDILVGNMTGDDVSNYGGAGDWSIYSGFARLTYNYKDKYLAEFNIRNDYSSYFSKDNRSGIFPSLSAGWRVSEEGFWKTLKPYIPYLKVRGSWGLVGNNRIGAYQYMQTVTVTNGMSFGDTVVPTASFASANPDIKWETTRMFDLGIDLGLLKNDLNITFDYFNNRTSDILVNLPVPGLFGQSAPIQNAGKVDTRGWEFSLRYRLTTGAFTHNFSGNISDSYNEVADVDGTETIGGYDVNTIIKEGYPLFSYYAYRSDGFFQTEEECAKGPHLDGVTPKPGDIKYIDKNKDGVIKPDDDRFIVGNDFPRYTYGFSYGVNFKGIFFSMMWQGVGKRDKWMRGESVEAFHNNNEGPVLDFHQDRWTTSNRDASYPRLTMGSESANNAAKSDFWIQDVSYLRLKNVQLGYLFPESLTQKIGIKKLQIYTSAENPLTFTKMKGGYDPEYTGDGSGRAYAVSKVYSLGLNITF